MVTWWDCVIFIYIQSFTRARAIEESFSCFFCSWETFVLLTVKEMHACGTQSHAQAKPKQNKPTTLLLWLDLLLWEKRKRHGNSGHALFGTYVRTWAMHPNWAGIHIDFDQEAGLCMVLHHHHPSITFDLHAVQYLFFSNIWCEYYSCMLMTAVVWILWYSCMHWAVMDSIVSTAKECFLYKTTVCKQVCSVWSAADVKMEIPVLVRSLKSSILSSTSFQMDKTVWRVVSAAVEQSRRKASMVAQGDGKFGPWGWPQDPSKPKMVCSVPGWCLYIYIYGQPTKRKLTTIW